MNAMVFCAGLGTRLAPLTADRPKAMVELAGEPLLGRCLHELKATGLIDKVVVNVHHFADSIERYLSETDFGLEIRVSDERDRLLDTGGGLWQAKTKLLPTNEPILLRNVDVLTDLDYAAMLEQHRRNCALATLAVRDRPTSRYLLFDEAMNLCGWRNERTGEQIGSDGRALAFSGVHWVSPKLFDTYQPTDDVFSIIDVYLQGLNPSAGRPTGAIAGFRHDADHWLDLGTPQRLAQAEKLLKNEL